MRIDFYQDNISFLKKGMLRGLHYQTKPYKQGKLVSVIKGKIFDIAVAIRPSLKYFGKYFSIILSDKNNLQFCIPEGFAHGFLVLEDSTLKYKTTNYFNHKKEKTIVFNDKSINIKWPKINKFIKSKKDTRGFYLKYHV